MGPAFPPACESCNFQLFQVPRGMRRRPATVPTCRSGARSEPMMLPLEERLMDAARDVCLRLNDQLTDCNSLQRLSETVERAVETALGVQCCTLLVLQEGGILQRWAEHKGRAPTL